MKVQLNMEKLNGFLDQDAMEEMVLKAAKTAAAFYEEEDSSHVLGWRFVSSAAVQLAEIKEKAEEIRKSADVFVVVGVGGSNQAARAMIDALQDSGPEIVYLGNSLSAHYIDRMMKRLEGKSIYINVIAKNFETLEPGSHFRILRRYMSALYGKEEMGRRIIVTGTLGSRLEEIAKENGYLFLQFPKDIGGRYSAFSPVSLLPAAVAGLDLDLFLKGGTDMESGFRGHLEHHPSIRYAAARNLLLNQGYDIELCVSFEPQFAYFMKWWIQLFGESEGKDQKGIFPSAAIYSEDLHSMGQYLQDGRRNLIETYLKVKNPDKKVLVEPDAAYHDNFDYLDGMDFVEINHIAEQATIEAHTLGGVPCIQFEMDQIDEETFGSLFYLCMLGCAVSGTLMGVNAFDQEGVEAYKQSMFQALGK